MSTPSNLPLTNIVDVIVEITPLAPQVPTFSQGLVVGPSTVIPSQGANGRIRQYNNTNQMLSDGFSTNSPEFICAQLYFSQSPAPTILWVGRQDLTALATVVPHAAAEGTGYVVGDLLTVVHAGASGGTVKVTTVGGAGNITGVQIVNGGTGYVVATGQTTTGGTGTGAQVDVNAVGETPLVAITACRVINSAWWAAMVTSAVTADHEAIAAYFQSISPVGCYFYTTSDASVLVGTGDVFSFMKANGFNRVIGFYSTTQGGNAPNNIYSCAAAMGYAMGANTGLAGSNFTLKFKKLVGIVAEPLSFNTVQIIEGNNGNLYLNYQNVYTIVEQGVLGSGEFFDTLLGLDMLTTAMIFFVMDLLTSTPSIPQTDPGQIQLIHAVNQACEASRIRGFLAGGPWAGAQILNLLPGNTLPLGYLSQSPPYSTQSQADRDARKAMPIYTAIIPAGAVHSIVIGVFVQP